MKHSKLLFCISGSIAAYKAAETISKLVQKGYEIQVVATKSALNFIGTATLEGLTGKKFNFFKTEEEFMQKAAKTPRSNCVLDTSKAEKAGIGMRLVEDAMIDSIRKMPQSVLS